MERGRRIQRYTEIHEEFDYQCKNCHDYFGASTVDDMYETLLASEVNGMLLLEPGDAEGSLVYVKLAEGPNLRRLDALTSWPDIRSRVGFNRAMDTGWCPDN